MKTNSKLPNSKLPNLFLAKGDPYARVVIDKTGVKKTETVKKTWEPIWNERFVV